MLIKVLDEIFSERFFKYKPRKRSQLHKIKTLKTHKRGRNKKKT